MGQQHSAQEAYRKLIAKEGLTLPVGSEVERLFYEDFKYDADAQIVTPTSATPTATEYDPSRFAHLEKTQWAPARPLSSARWREPESKKRPAEVPTAVVGDKWAPVIPAPKPMTYIDRLKYFPPGAAPEVQTSYFLSPEAALRRSASDPTKSSSGESSSSYVTEGDERWKERMRKRIADRQASDAQKARLSQVSRESSGSGLSSDLSPEEEG